MKNINAKLLLIVTTAILGLLFVLTNNPKSIEGFSLSGACYDLLIEKAGKLHLINTKALEVPGVNPLIFNNLEEYVEYFEWQRAHDISCPVLFLQHMYTAQGHPEYVERPSPIELQGGKSTMPAITVEPGESKLMDAYHDDPPYNQGMYPGFDPQNQYIGLKTPLDKMYNQDFDGVSPNQMDPNWGGPDLTQELVDKGYYEANNVFKIKSK